MSEELKNKKPIKLGSRIKKEITDTNSKIEQLMRHIKNVQDNCLLLGKKLIDLGEVQLGKHIIARGIKHDNSKFFGSEWDNMSTTPVNSSQVDPVRIKRNISINHHRQTNDHHPESWPNGISEMPRAALAEAVCDWKSRSEEFGTDFRQWIQDYAMKTWNFDEKSSTYKTVMEFVDLLCEKPFEPIKNTE